MELSRQRLLEIWERMQAIRRFEVTVHDEFAKGKIPGFVHLYAGEEAVAVGTCAHLTDDDFITSTHRGHGHCVAKGCDLNGMMAEIFGKATGLCRGKGGSMHIADVDKGMLGANGIVGGGFGLIAGAALTAKFNGKGQVAVCFFGDGASNQGSFHESANLATIWKLPVIYVAENNGYAETTPAHYSVATAHIADRAKAYGIPGTIVDGQDVFAVYDALAPAIARARAGHGPSLIECKTYRHYGHFEGDTQRYKRPEDMALYTGERDPLNVFKVNVLTRNLLTAADLTAVEEKVRQDVAAALKFAQESPLPVIADLETDVLATA